MLETEIASSNFYHLFGCRECFVASNLRIQVYVTNKFSERLIQLSKIKFKIIRVFHQEQILCQLSSPRLSLATSWLVFSLYLDIVTF